MSTGLLTDRGPQNQKTYLHFSKSYCRKGGNKQQKDFMQKREMLLWIMEAELAIQKFKANLIFALAEARKVPQVFHKWKVPP